jgi:uncharacterized protein YoxC
VGLKFNGTHQLLAYADYVNLLDDDIETTKKSTETLIDASKEVGQEVITESTKYKSVSRHQNAGQYMDIKIANTLLENIFQIRYLGNDRNKSKFDSGGN